jgi:ACS family allantoate permease-like MFS transporter
MDEYEKDNAASDPEKKVEINPEIEKQLPGVAQAVREGRIDENILKHSHDADEALKALQGHEGEIIEIDEATNKRILRRIDWNLIPVCAIRPRSVKDRDN